jgi:hypothetical protein
MNYVFSYLWILVFFTVVLGGVHCGIYKSSCTISDMSYLNSPLHHYPLCPSPNSWSFFFFNSDLCGYNFMKFLYFFSLLEEAPDMITDFHTFPLFLLYAPYLI